jgi:predicted TIM-barrel fold metal-dependent hydrolase
MHAIRIDVHHHLFPPAFVAGLVENEHYLARGVARHWTPQVSLDDMDAAGIATAFTSITAPGFDLFAHARRVAATRECNEYGARMMADHRGRFGLFASLPLPDIDASLREIEYALDTLKADGIGLLTSYRDQWLGDPVFAPVMEELNRRNAVAYVHPTAPDCCRNLMPGIADWVLEFPLDTTRTIASLLFSGTLKRCPGIRFIFAHVGGILPLMAEHLVRAAEVDAKLAAMVPGGVREALRRFHYDTALRMHPVGLSSALQLVDCSRLLLGTDAPLRRSIDQLQGLLAYGLAEQDLRNIEFENARRLLNR